ncbi:MAG: DUF2130 domain-containing protein [Actinomycetota bacterium]
MASPPKTCPYCGQPLVHEHAISHLRRKEAEIERERRSLERELRGKARAEARKAAQAEIKQKLKTAVAAEARKATALRKRLEKISNVLADLRSQRQELVRAHKAELVALRREAEVQKRKELREALRAQREQDREKISREERTKQERKFSRRQQALERSVKTLEEDKDRLERQVERLRAADQGEFNEEELLNILKTAFRDDELTRTRRGRAGADIFHHVRYRDGSGQWADAGLIIYECKDTLRWSNDFVAQAKRAGKAHEAAYTVLVSRAFPRGQKNLVVRADGVVVVHPSLLLHVAHVVRRMVEEIHRAGLGAGGQASKTEELFAYLRSERFKHAVAAIVNASGSLKEMLDSERDSHLRTWSRREKAYNEIREVTSTIDEDIRVIIERPHRSRRGKVVPIKGAY